MIRIIKVSKGRVKIPEERSSKNTRRGSKGQIFEERSGQNTTRGEEEGSNY